MYLVEQSGAAITHNGQRFELSPDAMLVIPANTPIAANSTTLFRNSIFHFRLIDPENEAVCQPVSIPLTQKIGSAHYICDARL